MVGVRVVGGGHQTPGEISHGERVKVGPDHAVGVGCKRWLGKGWVITDGVTVWGDQGRRTHLVVKLLHLTAAVAPIHTAFLCNILWWNC